MAEENKQKKKSSGTLLLVKKVSEKVEEKKEELHPLPPQPVPYEEKHELSKLKLFFIIVQSGQADAIIKLLNKEDVAACFVASGKGTGNIDIYNVIGLAAKKQVVMAVVSEEHTEKVIKLLENRFSVSRAAKGVAFSIKLTSIAGVSIYKFLSNTRIAKEKKKWKK